PDPYDERGNEGRCERDVVGEHREQAAPRPAQRVGAQEGVDPLLDHHPVDAHEAGPRQQLADDEDEATRQSHELADLLHGVAGYEAGDDAEGDLLHPGQNGLKLRELHLTKRITPRSGPGAGSAAARRFPVRAARAAVVAQRRWGKIAGVTRASNVRIADAVQEALASGTPVVALESTVVTHGLPRPRNLELARRLEAAVREEGGVPATIGVVGGDLVVGVSEAELERLAAGGADKASLWNLARSEERRGGDWARLV